MSGYQVNTTDLDDIFAPLTGYTPVAAACGYQVNGVDLNQRYLPRAAGVAAAATNFLKNTADLNTIFSGRLTAGLEFTIPGSGSWSVPRGVDSITVVVVGGGAGGFGYYNSFFGTAIRVNGNPGGNSTLSTSGGISITANGGYGGYNGGVGAGGGYSVYIPGTGPIPSPLNIAQANYYNYSHVGVTQTFTKSGINGVANTGGAGFGGGGGTGGYVSYGGDGSLNPTQSSSGYGYSSYTGGGGGGQSGDGGPGGSNYLLGLTAYSSQAGGTPSNYYGVTNYSAIGSGAGVGRGGGETGGFGGGGGGGALVWATNISVTYGQVFNYTVGVGGTGENGGNNNGLAGGVGIMYGNKYNNFPIVV